MSAEFKAIIRHNYRLTGVPMGENMPAITPGEGSAFGLAALLIGSGLVADLSERVQIAAIIGGVLLGIAGTVATATIRKARNKHGSAKALASASLLMDDD